MANEYLYKPDIIKIRGVHGTNEGDNQEADIGFPMVGMHTLFENAVVKAYDGDYTDTKKLAYKREGETTYTDIENQAHFTCISQGYNDLTSIDEYYQRPNGINYVKHTVNHSKDWNTVLKESNDFSKHSAVSINNPDNATHVVIGDDDYFDFDGTDYIRCAVSKYTQYGDGNTEIDWDTEYCCGYNDDLEEITWYTKNNVSLQGGQFIYKDGLSIRYIGNISFNDNGTAVEYSLGYYKNIYRITSNNISSLYVIINGKMQALSNTLVTSDDGNIYYKLDDEGWRYPNKDKPNQLMTKLCKEDNTVIEYNSTNFPLYKDLGEPNSIRAEYISRAPLYEKTGVLLNYKYNDKGDILKIPFVEEGREINEILTTCGLNEQLAKYVHLTNLTYVE